MNLNRIAIFMIAEKRPPSCPLFFASIPIRTLNMIQFRTLNLDAPSKFLKHKEKKRFTQFASKKRNALLILPRYDHSLQRSVVDIIDLSTFQVIHRYQHDVADMNSKVLNLKEFSRINIDDAPVRFQYRHPLILDDGSLISDSEYSPEFKIDICSNLEWINDDQQFHHSKMLDSLGNIWIPSLMRPQSRYVNTVSYTHLRAHETGRNLVCRLLL